VHSTVFFQSSVSSLAGQVTLAIFGISGIVENLHWLVGHGLPALGVQLSSCRRTSLVISAVLAQEEPVVCL